MKSLILALTVLASLNAYARKHAEKHKDIPECAEVTKACEAAGFKPGDHKKGKKGLWIDCVGALAEGKTVEGVSATKEQAEACVAAKKNHKHK